MAVEDIVTTEDHAAREQNAGIEENMRPKTMSLLKVMELNTMTPRKSVWSLKRM